MIQYLNYILIFINTLICLSTLYQKFTHLHKTLEGELESNMDYVEHRPSHYFDSVCSKLKEG